MEIKFANHENYTFKEILSAKNNGGSFIAYQWIIPTPIFFPIRRLSKVYFIPKNESKSKYAFKFNLITLIIGWLGLPWGPVAVYQTIFINRNGGIDITDDVYLNIDETSYNKGKLIFSKSFTKFVHPKKSEVKEHIKVFRTLVDAEILNELPIIGFYVASEKNIDPYTIILFNESIIGKEELITTAIYKRFTKHYKFELISNNDDYEFKNELLSQGLKLTDRQQTF